MKRRDIVVRIIPADAGARLKDLQKSRLDKVKSSLIAKGITNFEQQREEIERQEVEDFQAMESNRKYVKQMILGNRPIPEKVLKFYEEKCEKPEGWILYGNFSDYVRRILNPLMNTVREEDCLKVEIEAGKKNIVYGEVDEIIKIAENLKIIPEITPFTNLVDVYDRPNGKGLLLLFFNKYKDIIENSGFQPVINQMIKSANNKQAKQIEIGEAYLKFINEIVRNEFDRQHQNALPILLFCQKTLFNFEDEIIDVQYFSSAEKDKIGPKYHKMLSGLQVQKNIVIEEVKEEFGFDVTDKEVRPYLEEWTRLLTSFELMDSNDREGLRKKIQLQILPDDLEIAFAFQKFASFDREKRERVIKILKKINQILEEDSVR